MKFRSLIPLSAIAIAGCKGGSDSGYVPKAVESIPQAAVKPGEEASLFPLAVGNQWTFSITSQIATATQRQTSTGEVTLRVVDVQPDGDGKKATLEMVSKGKVTEKQLWVVNSKGIYQLGKGPTVVKMFSAPEPVILFPIEVDKKNTWKGSEGPISRTYDFTCKGVQEVDTDEKRMSAFAIESVGTNISGKLKEQTASTAWFAPGVGIVRYTELTGTAKAVIQNVLKLKSHTVK